MAGPPRPPLGLLPPLLLLLACGAALAAAKGKRHIRQVSLVFSWHLDIGFHSNGPEPGYDNAVITRYHNEYYPQAARVAEALRQRGGPERAVFMTHSFMLSLFFDCPARIGIACPNATTVEEVARAIKQGDITWHALPHNAQVELFDDSLLSYAVRLTHDLDRRFGLPPKVTMSQRDVPGLTRAAIPVLAFAGVKAISVGVNGASAPPDVPKNTPFIWRDPPSGSELLGMWHPGGYSGVPVDGADECVQAHGFHHALCYAWRSDNTGPHSVDEVLDIFSRVRAAFPHATVTAAGLDGFVGDLLEAAPKLDLPVVTEEIGDTWAYGIASDPAKLSEYRALLRMRRAAEERYDDPAFQRFSRLLLKLPEHTWGVDTKQHPADYTAWSNADFQRRLRDKGPNNPFAVAVGSWVRQRAYSLWAVQELGTSDLGKQAWEALAALQTGRAPPTPGAANSSFKRSSLHEPLLFESPSWQVQLSNLTGAIVGLRFQLPSSSGGGASSGRPEASSADASPWRSLLARLRLPGASLFAGQQGPTGQWAGGSSSGSGSWAGLSAPMALPIYSTYSEDDYSVLWDSYTYRQPGSEQWYPRDFGKPNATSLGGARRADYLPQAEAVWWRRGDDGSLHIVVRSAFDSHGVSHAGAPAVLWTEIRMPAGRSTLELDVTWERKTATRLPEAVWLRWVPQQDAVDPDSWRLFKLGQPISPLEVMRNGSQSMHAVGDEGVTVDSADGRSRLRIRSLDAALVSPGAPTPFPVVADKPDMRKGVSHCLVNNIWGTNYIMWFPYTSADANQRFRFVLEVEQTPSAGAPQADGAAALEGAAAAA